MLRVTNVTARYGPIVALRSVSLGVNEGEIVTLLGSNAAGKTTLMKAIVGLLPIAEGSIEYDGQRIDALPTVARVARRISLIPEGRGILGKMTVLENLLMGAYLRRSGAEVDADLGRVFEVFPLLAARRWQVAGTLSGGEQQMLAIARGLMSRPRLLLMDEPSMGLAPILVARVFETVERIRALGITVFVVEQNAKVALDLADRAYVLERGAIVMEGRAQDLKKDETIRNAYLGEA